MDGQGPIRFGRYQLLAKLAQGGMAEVFRAKGLGAAGFEKDLAIKRILPHLSADEGFVRMFIDEARLAARLGHRNIVTIFDFDEVDGAYYIAMELVDGCDLRRLIHATANRKARLPIPIALYIATEMLKGLGYAHSKTADDGRPLELVHRDVSPHNVLLSRAGEVKLSDFGIAKAQTRATSTGSGVIKGKLRYMSPEQARGERIDSRTDLFAAGVVLYEMLTSRRLFAGDEEMEVLHAVQRCEVLPPSLVNPEVSPALDRAVLGLLARDPAERIATAANAVRALAACPGYADQSEALGGLVRALTEGLETTRPERHGPTSDAVPVYIETKVDWGGARAGDRSVSDGAGTGARAALGSGASAADTNDLGATKTRAGGSQSQSHSIQPISVVTALAPRSPRRWLMAVALLGLLGAAGFAARAWFGRRVEPLSAASSRGPAVEAGPAAASEKAAELPATTPRHDASAPPPDAAPTASPPAVASVSRARRSALPSPATTGKGTLTVIVKPWANVFVDGLRIRQTPLRDHELGAGPHEVILDMAGRKETIHVSITPAHPTELRRDWTKPAGPEGAP